MKKLTHEEQLKKIQRLHTNNYYWRNKIKKHEEEKEKARKKIKNRVMFLLDAVDDTREQINKCSVYQLIKKAKLKIKIQKIKARLKENYRIVKYFE